MRRSCTTLMMAALATVGCADASDEAVTVSDTAASTDGDDDDGTNDDDTEEPGEFGPEESLELRLAEDAPPPLVLEMDRAEVTELFGASASEVLLLELDSTVLLTETLENVKYACGDAWESDDPDPNHDCSLTALGQTFAGPDGTWQTSAEYALVRILTMTPANTVVTGTSSESLQELSDALDIGGGYGQILAEALGIPRTQSIVSTDGLVKTFRENFVSSHPNVGAGGKLAITLEDALTDMASMTDRYGPMDGHPGVVDPSFVVHGEVLGPDFQMRAVAESNLRVVDGIDGDQGKGFMSVVADLQGPTYGDELEFDFADPERFALTGLVDSPTVDLRFRTSEVDYFVQSCLGDPPCQSNAPETPVDAASVWSVSKWMLEYNITAGAKNDYQDRIFYGSYAVGTAKVLIGQDGNPPGWIEYDIPFGIGSPPEPQYIWETILEVAQVALHNTPFSVIPEGEGNVAFTLFDVPCGLSGPDAAEAVRPYLQDQAAKLSDFILGDYKKNNDNLDVYYQRGEDGEPYLFFVTESDLRDGEPYTYAHPGFYRTSAIESGDKVSRAVVVGLSDTTHEKLAIPEGETVVYYEDDGGELYRLRIERVAGTDELRVALARKVR
jgi:hypothetical protein